VEAFQSAGDDVILGLLLFTLKAAAKPAAAAAAVASPAASSSGDFVDIPLTNVRSVCVFSRHV
jgi:hypothetical protein